MPSPVEIAVDAYIRANREPDASVREQLLTACFAPDGRMVSRSRVLQGRTAIAAELTKFVTDPEVLGFRLTTAVDAVGNTFRYGSVVERRDGKRLEFFDAGQIDESGRISVLLVFAGALREVAQP
ncbi:MAG TPA: hypothetical protein VFS67_19840 [Polyangiaceae bacterium]|jgi:hypothetical protein|nr:hypothetical protein [Polyangiaceae bacterium]